jgi:hypothetical protein
MKTLTTLAAVAALIAGMSLANAQNAGGPAGPNASPGNINKGSDPSSPKGAQSGSESSGTAMKSGGTKDRVVGTGKFCVQVSKSGSGVECKFASMDACTKEAQPRGLQCSPNPNMGTTGSR